MVAFIDSTDVEANIVTLRKALASIFRLVVVVQTVRTNYQLLLCPLNSLKMVIMSPPSQECRMAASMGILSLLGGSLKRDEVEPLKGIQRGLAPCVLIVPLSRAICNFNNIYKLIS